MTEDEATAGTASKTKIPHCWNSSKNKDYHTAGTAPKTKIPHCWNSSKNKDYHTAGTAPKTKKYHTAGTGPKTKNTTLLELVGLITTYAIRAYHQKCCDFESRSGEVY
jgi:hypothetical protein